MHRHLLIHRTVVCIYVGKVKSFKFGQRKSEEKNFHRFNFKQQNQRTSLSKD